MNRDQWIIEVRELLSNEAEFIGPFRSQDRADAVVRRLRGDLDAVGADHLYDVLLRQLRPGAEAVDLREELLEDLERAGYTAPPSGASKSGEDDRR